MAEKIEHWENVYQTKASNEVSWTQVLPQPSLDLILNLGLPKDAAIMDCGAGDSVLVDLLLAAGYTNITVLDISAAALEKAKRRLGPKASTVNWVVSDILDYQPDATFALWHDRAVFHFLTTSETIARYRALVSTAVTEYLIVGTFSATGPEKCSGLPVSRYDEADLQSVFSHDFSPIGCQRQVHVTPFHTTQDFVFCSFKRR